MPAPVYITPAGFAAPTLAEILSGLETDQRSLISPLLDTDPRSPVGQLNGIFAERLHALAQAVQVAYNGIDADQAAGRQLDAVADYTGTERHGASRSSFAGTHALEVDLDASTDVPVGTRFTTSAGAPVFEAVQDPDLALGLAASSTTAGTYQLAARCTTLGPVRCFANTLTVIVDSVSGLNAVTNPFHATLGRDEDTDPRLRVRRSDELGALGQNSLDAIQAKVLRIQNDDESFPVLRCVVYENTSLYYDADNRPGKSLEVLVWDGVGLDADDNAIAQVIWNNKAAGIEPFGNTSGLALDALGVSHLVPFSRPAVLNLRIQIDVTVRPGVYEGDAAVAAAVLARFGRRATMGESVIAEDYSAAALFAVRGTVDVTRLQIGRTTGPLNGNKANFAVTTRQIPLLQLADIAVSSTVAT